MQERRVIKFLLMGGRVTVSLALCWLIIRQIEWDKVQGLIGQLSFITLVSACGYLLLAVGLAAKRWQVLLSGVGQPFSWAFLARTTFIGFFFNQGLPTSVGGDIYRVYRLRDKVDSFSLAFFSVLVDRFYGLAALVIIANLSLFSSFLAVVPAYFCQLSLIMLAGTIGGLGILWRGHYFAAPFAKFGLRSACWLWTMLSHLSSIGCFVALSKGLGIPFTWLQAFLVVPVVYLASALPFSFAGWGVREGAMVYMFQTLGLETSAALALSLTYGLVQLLIAGVGLILWWQEKQAFNKFEVDSNLFINYKPVNHYDNRIKFTKEKTHSSLI